MKALPISASSFLLVAHEGPEPAFDLSDAGGLSGDRIHQLPVSAVEAVRGRRPFEFSFDQIVKVLKPITDWPSLEVKGS